LGAEVFDMIVDTKEKSGEAKREKAKLVQIHDEFNVWVNSINIISYCSRPFLASFRSSSNRLNLSWLAADYPGPLSLDFAFHLFTFPASISIFTHPRVI
jgi:hypothetical protein